MNQDAFARARQLCVRMTDRQILEEYSKGSADVVPEAWAALESEFKRRNLRFRPWKDQSYILLTTAPSAEGYRVIRTLDIVSSECVLGLGFLRDYAASITDVIGGRSLATETALRDGKKTCLQELRNAARDLSADAVIAVDLDYSEFSGQGKSMMLLVATGTAVQLERIAAPVTPDQHPGLGRSAPGIPAA